MNAKVVVNIHFYENALVEQVRIFECLSLNIPVVSECGRNYRELSDYLKKNVSFATVGHGPNLLRQILIRYNQENKYNYEYRGDCSKLIDYLTNLNV